MSLIVSPTLTTTATGFRTMSRCIVVVYLIKRYAVIYIYVYTYTYVYISLSFKKLTILHSTERFHVGAGNCIFFLLFCFFFLFSYRVSFHLYLPSFIYFHNLLSVDIIRVHYYSCFVSFRLCSFLSILVVRFASFSFRFIYTHV